MEEQFDVCDETGRPTGQSLPRSLVHRRGLWHRSSHLWVFDSRGNVLLQRRHPGKETDPGRWDIAVAGHVSAGQSPEQAIVREAREELALTLDPARLAARGVSSKQYVEPSFVDREWQHLYSTVWDGSLATLVLQEDEVTDVRWLPLPEYRRLVEDLHPDYVDRRSDLAMVLPRFAVLGSLNQDLVTRAPRFPRPGETLTGSDFAQFPGGKGANQAVALARLGGRPALFGALGDDALGAAYEAVLDREGVDRRGVERVAGVSTGTASIVVTDSGENQILVVPGANGRVDARRVAAWQPGLQACTVLLLQLEVPLEAVVAAARLVHGQGGLVILDPAPATPLPPDLYPLIDVITPNEDEAARLTGQDVGSEEGLRAAAETLGARGVKTVIITAGPRGAYLWRPGSWTLVEGRAVAVVDTVGAGDTFNAALALGLGLGLEVAAALRLANGAGALATTRLGAQAGMPRLAEVQALLETPL